MTQAAETPQAAPVSAPAPAPAEAGPAVQVPEDEIPVVDATPEMFETKRPAQDEMVFPLDGKKVRIHFVAIGRKEYDAMLTWAKPTTAQRADGMNYNQEMFAPRLMSRVIDVPQMSEAQWRNIWNDDNWNRAELGDIFYKATEVCAMKLDPGPTVTD